MGITISKKTYWTTLIYLFSALANIALCFVLIPPLGISGAAMASALSAILTLLLRTAVGERYYRAILNYRYLAADHRADDGGVLPEPAADGHMEIRGTGAGAGAGLRAVPCGASYPLDHRRTGAFRAARPFQEGGASWTVKSASS